MVLDLIAVAATVLLLDDVSGIGEVGDNGVRAAFGDVEARRDVAQAHLRIMDDAQEGSAIVGEETPLGHHRDYTQVIPESYC